MAVDRIVIVGCGSIGQRHARLLARRPNLKIDLCDPNLSCLDETMALVGERTCYNDFSEVLTSKPDAVVLATPHAMHADQAVEALEAGVHVLCEKPMSANLDDAKRMIQASEVSDKVLDIGFTLHFCPPLIRLKEIIGEGMLGQVVHVHCRVGTYATLASSRTQHQADLEGSLLLDYVHQPDILCWLLDCEPKQVYMSAMQIGELPLSSNPNVADVHVEFKSGIRSTIHLNYIQEPQRHEYEVVGDLGWARLDAENNTLEIGLRSNSTIQTESFSYERDDMFFAEHTAFFDAIAGKRSPESPAVNAAKSTRIMDAAMCSWKQGIPIPLADMI